MGLRGEFSVCKALTEDVAVNRNSVAGSRMVPWMLTLEGVNVLCYVARGR